MSTRKNKSARIADTLDRWAAVCISILVLVLIGYAIGKVLVTII